MRASKSITKTPASVGPDVVYNNGGFDVYVDGHYLGSRTTSQNAWIDARAVHFENVEDSAIVTADNDAECRQSAAKE